MDRCASVGYTNLDHAKWICGLADSSQDEKIAMLLGEIERTERYQLHLVERNRELEKNILVLQTMLEVVDEPCEDIKRWKTDWLQNYDRFTNWE